MDTPLLVYNIQHKQRYIEPYTTTHQHTPTTQQHTQHWLPVYFTRHTHEANHHPLCMYVHWCVCVSYSLVCAQSCDSNTKCRLVRGIFYDVTYFNLDMLQYTERVNTMHEVTIITTAELNSHVSVRENGNTRDLGFQKYPIKIILHEWVDQICLM